MAIAAGFVAATCVLLLGTGASLVGRAAPGIAALALVALCLLGLTAFRRPTELDRALAAARLETEELARQRDAAENANISKSRYLASVSHEIRSPLNSIYGYAQLMERGEGISPLEAAQVIRRSAEHLNSLIEGLLDISQVERGLLRVKADEIRFDAFLQQIVSMFRPAAEARGLDFHYIVATPLPRFVRVDQNRLRQVLINLLSNAIKFTDAGSVTLKVAYTGQIARFEVSDTGPGIPPEDQAQMFEPYERGTKQDRLPGVGLGLSITKALVQILGGDLQMESQPGVGTTQRVTLMVPDVAGKMEEQASPGHVTGYLGPRKSVLVADDDPEQLALIETLLTSLGFEVSAAPSGEAAVDCCADRSFDLAILDISMPGISGWETAVRLRENVHGDLSIVMLSANSQEFHRPDHAHAVHDLFLVKPVDFADLVKAIGGLLHLTWTWGEPTPRPAAPTLDLNDAAHEHVTHLIEFLRIGYVRGIEEEIRRLAAADPGATELVARLIDALDRFDLAGMAAILEGER